MYPRRKAGVPRIDNALIIVGSDEAGYGNWAGPLCVVAVLAPSGWDDPWVRDSKQITDEKRRALKDRYLNDSGFKIVPVLVEAPRIDALGGGYKALLWAHGEAIRGCVKGLATKPLVVIDGTLPVDRLGLEGYEILTLPKADQKVPEVALASCIAKTLQVDAMLEADRLYPRYGFSRHKGYGTKEHAAALERLGPCPIHRTSYAPIRKALQTKQPQKLWEVEPAAEEPRGPREGFKQLTENLLKPT